MSAFKSLFKQTFIYGLATVLPRMLSYFLVRLHTDDSVLNSVADYGSVSLIYAYFVLFNVLLSYGMETSFFRFFNKEGICKKTVVSTSTITLFASSTLFLLLGYLFKDTIAFYANLKEEYITIVLWTLFLDALVIIPFAWLRANAKSMRYAIIKLINVSINLGLNLFLLLYLKDLASGNSFFNLFYKSNYEINYIFISGLVASFVTLLLLSPFYIKLSYTYSVSLVKEMLRYSFPVLIAGIAFSVNEVFDRFLLEYLLPEKIAKAEIGVYSACYKLALFMTLFATAYRLGIEPYFFSHSKSENPQNNYARILEFFVMCGSAILLGVVVFVDVLKIIVIPNKAYWHAMNIVPLLLIAYLCLGIYHNLSVWYKVTDKTKYGAYISIIGATVTLVLNYVLIPYYSYLGSAIATLSAYAIMVVLSFGLGQKHYPVPYNLKKIGLYLGTSITLSMICFYQFRGQYLIGISALVVFLTVIFLSEKQNIKALLKNK